MERPITTLFMLMSANELSQLKALKIEECEVLENSYLRLRYKVMN